jgi:hypothetical protein
MIRCLNERTLLLLHDGDGTQSQRAHLGECNACTSRYKKLGRDLEAISHTLRERPPPIVSPDPLRFSVRGWSVGAALAIALLLIWTSEGLRTRMGFSPGERDRIDETRSILDDLPSNPFWTTEALAMELATEGVGSFELAAAVLEAGRPCEWYDLPLLSRAEGDNEAVELSEANSQASCVEVSQGHEKPSINQKSSKKSPKHEMEELR